MQSPLEITCRSLFCISLPAQSEIHQNQRIFNLVFLFGIKREVPADRYDCAALPVHRASFLLVCSVYCTWIWMSVQRVFQFVQFCECCLWFFLSFRPSYSDFCLYDHDTSVPFVASCSLSVILLFECKSLQLFFWNATGKYHKMVSNKTRQIQVSPALFEYGQSKLKENSKSCANYTPISNVLICPLNFIWCFFFDVPVLASTGVKTYVVCVQCACELCVRVFVCLCVRCVCVRCVCVPVCEIINMWPRLMHFPLIILSINARAWENGIFRNFLHPAQIMDPRFPHK